MPKVHCQHLSNVHWLVEQPADWRIRGVADIWRIPVMEESKVMEWGSDFLHYDEFMRARRFARKEDKLRFLISRASLRLLISMYTGSRPGEIEFGEGENKKPFIKNLEFAFFHNIAHSGEWILISFADSPLGVDLEQFSEQLAFEEILSMVFNDEEMASIRQSNPPRSRFYQLWTRKESMVKATAKGIDDDITSIPSLEGIHDVSGDAIGSDLSWNIFSFGLFSNYYGSMACSPSISEIRFFDLEALLHARETNTNSGS